mmetsp:Transcript_172674/g.553417  ORF Transcript_172674/g.553417 Transcript_172674/m.553417 type:complete len:201 (+) Transcript_172674:970-1572(+)
MLLRNAVIILFKVEHPCAKWPFRWFERRRLLFVHLHLLQIHFSCLLRLFVPLLFGLGVQCVPLLADLFANNSQLFCRIQVWILRADGGVDPSRPRPEVFRLHWSLRLRWQGPDRPRHHLAEWRRHATAQKKHHQCQQGHLPRDSGGLHNRPRRHGHLGHPSLAAVERRCGCRAATGPEGWWGGPRRRRHRCSAASDFEQG